MWTLSFSIMRKTRRLSLEAVLWIVMSTVLLLGLSSCGNVREEVTIRPGERWKVELHIAVSPSDMLFIGDPAAIESRLEEARQDPDAAAANYKWSKEASDDGGVVYIVEQSGKGLQSLNSAAFDELATFSRMTYGEKEAIHFVLNPQSAFSELGYYELVMRTGEVLETNGELLEDGVVRWVGAYQAMEAIFRPSKGVDPLLIIGLIVLIVTIAAALWLLRNRQQQQNVQIVMAANAYCHQCGQRMGTTGPFCPNCGTRRL